MTTSFMNLTLPTVSVTIGPDWATEINTALTSIDAHDHSTSKGTKITPSGINITAALEYNTNAITGLGSNTYTNLGALIATTNTAYVKDGDLYFNDAAANQVRITSGGALNVGTVGGIGGDYGTTAATVFYTDASLTYFFQDSAAAPGKIDAGDISAEAITGTSFVGPGSLPLGAVIPIAANLTGAMTIPSTGTVDSNGFQLCDGASIDGAATMTGTIYDLSDERFLVGSTTAGSTGGANSTDLSHTHTSASHTHTMGTHTHNMKHTHQVGYGDFGSSVSRIYFQPTNSNSSTSFTTTTQQVYEQAAMASGGAINGRVAASSATPMYSTGVINGNSGTGSSALTSATDPGDTNSKTPGATGSSLSASYNNRPLYLSAVYVMRVL